MPALKTTENPDDLVLLAGVKVSKRLRSEVEQAAVKDGRSRASWQRLAFQMLSDIQRLGLMDDIRQMLESTTSASASSETASAE